MTELGYLIMRNICLLFMFVGLVIVILSYKSFIITERKYDRDAPVGFFASGVLILTISLQPFAFALSELIFKGYGHLGMSIIGAAFSLITVITMGILLDKFDMGNRVEEVEVFYGFVFVLNCLWFLICIITVIIKVTQLTYNNF